MDLVRHKLNFLTSQGNAPNRHAEMRALLLEHNAAHGMEKDYPLTEHEQSQVDMHRRFTGKGRAAFSN